MSNYARSLPTASGSAPASRSGLRCWATVQRGIVDIERTAAFREVVIAPPPREEDGVLIISVVEDRLVERTFVVEEVRVRIGAAAETAELQSSVRVMRAEVEGAGNSDGEQKQDHA